MPAKHAEKRGWLEYVRTFEPARYQAAYAAAVLGLAGVGVTLSPAVDKWVGGGLIVLGVVVPLVQGELTRAGVFAPGNVLVAADHVGKAVIGPGAGIAPEGTPANVVPEAVGSGRIDAVQGVVPVGSGPGPVELQVDGLRSDPVDEDGQPIVDLASVTMTPEEQDSAGT